MKNKWYIVSLLLFILTFVCFNTRFYALDGEKDLEEAIIQKTNSNIEEYGVTTSFVTKADGRKITDTLLEDLGYRNHGDVTVFERDDVYRLEFKSGSYYGYVESAKEEDGNIIKIDIKDVSSRNNLQSLKESIEKSVEKYYRNPEMFTYLKAKCPCSDTKSTNETIVNLLEKNGTINIDTCKLLRSYSTVCYTKRYDPILISGKLMDFNFAVCSYSSGDYIIMGTPEIIETY
jgi:hypothetical protein